MVKCRIVSVDQCLESTMKHGLLTCMSLKVHKIVENGNIC